MALPRQAGVADAIQESMYRHVVVPAIIDDSTLNAATADSMRAAVRKAPIGDMAALSEAQGVATKEAQRAGLRHAETKGVASPDCGRASIIDRTRLDAVATMFGCLVHR